MRLLSALEERNTWLESIVQAVLGKNMRQMRDEDELVVYDKFRDGLQALDNYIVKRHCRRCHCPATSPTR